MPICVIRKKATPQEIDEMLKTLEAYLKVAVDIRQRILAGGGVMHADCEAVLLAEGSQQADIWGANWDPQNHSIEFEALINIRPKANHRSMIIQDRGIRSRVEEIIRDLLEGKGELR